MLLTSGQVSLAISSFIVFIFTTALFLCGYVVQQKTVNDIREAIKPQPRPVHTNLYVPPGPDSTPIANPTGEDGVQIIEIPSDPQQPKGQDESSLEAAATKQPPEQDDTEEEEGLIHGADGGFLKKQSKSQSQSRRQRKAKGKALLEALISDETDDPVISNLQKSADASTPDEMSRLSRAARRKLIKDEFVKLAGEDLLNDPKAYRRRRFY